MENVWRKVEGKWNIKFDDLQFMQDPHDMELLEEVDETDLEADAYAVFND